MRDRFIGRERAKQTESERESERECESDYGAVQLIVIEPLLIARPRFLEAPYRQFRPATVPRILPWR